MVCYSINLITITTKDYAHNDCMRLTTSENIFTRLTVIEKCKVKGYCRWYIHEI
jgi:hypothetical protein